MTPLNCILIRSEEIISQINNQNKNINANFVPKELLKQSNEILYAAQMLNFYNQNLIEVKKV